MSDNNYIIVVMGLGYIGVPLAELFSREYLTKGYDKKLIGTTTIKTYSL